MCCGTDENVSADDRKEMRFFRYVSKSALNTVV